MALAGDWAWEEVKAVYLDERYELQLDQFLEQDHNVHVKSNMLPVILVAIHKGFWNASPETTAELAEQFADLVSQHGLPGSGHTDPSHPILPWLAQHLEPESWYALAQVIQAAQAQPDSDLLTRGSPIPGLMGTLIPLGPGLSALGDGNIDILATALTIAFDTTVVGLLVGLVSYTIARIRRRWYEQCWNQMYGDQSRVTA